MAGALTREAILASAEDVLRRYGPAKTSVVDIARALGVSHGTVYRPDGEFASGDPGVLGRAVLQATARFHHPLHAAEWDDPGLAADFDAVYALVLRGLIA